MKKLIVILVAFTGIQAADCAPGLEDASQDTKILITDEQLAQAMAPEKSSQTSCTDKIRGFFSLIKKHKLDLTKVALSAGAYCGITYVASKIVPPYLAPMLTGTAGIIAVYNRVEIRFLVEDRDPKIKYPVLIALSAAGYISDIFSGVPLGFGNLALSSLGNTSKREQKEKKKAEKEAKRAKKEAKKQKEAA